MKIVYTSEQWATFCLQFGRVLNSGEGDYVMVSTCMATQETIAIRVDTLAGPVYILNTNARVPG